MRTRSRRLSFPALLAVLLFALGGTGARASEGAPRAMARGHFERGTTLYQQGRYAEAATAFEAAYQAVPNGVVRYNLGQCYEKLGDLSRAIDSYRAYLREVPRAEDRPEVEANITRLEKRLGEQRRVQVSISSEPADAEVRMDGAVLGRTPWRDRLEVGPHRLELNREGHQPLGRELEVRPGEPLRLHFVLTPLPAKEVRATGARPRVWTWVAAATAGAATAGAVTLGLLAREDSRTLLTGKREREEAQRLHDSALGKARGANILYGVAGAAVAAGTVLFFVEGSF